MSDADSADDDSEFLDQTIHYQAPDCLSLKNSEWLDKLEAAKLSEEEAQEECTICLGELCDHGNESDVSGDGKAGDDSSSVAHNTVVRLQCGHLFHRECVKQAIKHKPICPTCRKPVQDPQGTCPSGSMQIEVDEDSQCPGFDDCESTITINYSIPNGRQKNFHENPGVRYGGTHRTAYLPNNKEGKDLLRRLIFAWKHGLIFTVGTSLTTGASNSVTWTSIHHKTSLWGGAHGFPDSGYILNCNESLDALYVPDAEACGAEPAPATPAITTPTITTHALASTTAVTSGSTTAASAHGTLDTMSPLLNQSIRYDAPRSLPDQNDQATTPQGTGPSGTMHVSVESNPCPGFKHSDGSQVGTIQIVYDIPGGRQKSYHENPGVRYGGTHRTAYLPHTKEGEDLLFRLIFAWNYGLNFDVGTSLTTGMGNSVIWSTVKHKTSLNGGMFGFPDSEYLESCDSSLDALHVPDAETCRAAAENEHDGASGKRKAGGFPAVQRSTRSRA